MNITKVYLLDTPLEKDYRNTLYFSSKQAQYTYFYSKRVKTYTDFTYQKKDKYIRVPDEYDNLLNCNYVMYQNTAQTNKWMYAFIDKLEYVSEGVTNVYIKTDVIQSYLFDYTIQPSFIEREHVSDDTLGKHTLPEGLELGEYTVIADAHDSYNTTTCMIMGSTVEPVGATNVPGNVYTGIPSGITYFRFDSMGTKDTTDPTTLNGAINYLNQQGRIEGVQSLFIAPTWIATLQTGTPYIMPSNSPEVRTFGITRISALDGYTPRNKKLLTFPYCFIELSNNIGQATTYYQERWTLSSGEMKLQMSGSIAPGGSIRCYPLNYNGDDAAYDEGITLGKFPSLSWLTDHYTNWLTQNALNLGSIKLNAEESRKVGAALGALKGGAEIAVGNYAGGAVSVVAAGRDILDSMQETYRHQLVPNTAQGNLNSGDVTAAMNINCFHWFKKTIKSEYAQIIDQYFDMFGYKVNTVKTPNYNHRQNWWYTKTIACNITGAIPNEDLDLIKTCYNNGITFWKDPTKIYDYTQSNSIVS